MNDPRNRPFDDVVALANQQISRGRARTFQKFTCSSCGSRQTMTVPNKFYETGTCEECGHVTNIRETGCGFALLLSFSAEAAQVADAVILAQREDVVKAD